jgi:hypothetical protein
MAYLPVAFSAAFLDSNADPISGATVTVTIRNAAGTAVVTSGAMTERTGEGGSYYEYIYTPVADTTYTGVASTNHASALQNWLLVGSATAEQDNSGGGLTAADVWAYDPRTLTSSSNVIVVSPLNPANQLLTIVATDSYTTGVDSTPLDFESANFPVLSGGTIEFNARHQTYFDDTFSKAGSVVSASIARVELTSAETGGMLAGLWSFELVATLSDATQRTLVSGQMNVLTPIPGNV